MSRQLHQTLLRHSTRDDRHRGCYKTLPNHVVAKDADGREIGVVFATTTPFDTPREMEELVQWASKALDKSAMHPLLVIAVFKVVFLAIHPFQDGNGRLSRILTTLLLLRAGKANLAIKVEQEKTASDSSLPLLSVQVLKLLEEHERLTIAQIVEITGANQNTLKVRLRELVNEGRIQRHGKARATWYSIA